MCPEQQLPEEIERDRQTRYHIAAEVIQQQIHDSLRRLRRRRCRQARQARQAREARAAHLQALWDSIPGIHEMSDPQNYTDDHFPYENFPSNPDKDPPIQQSLQDLWRRREEMEEYWFNINVAGNPAPSRNIPQRPRE